MEFVTFLIIAACFAVGAYYQAFSDKIDAPAEQVAEQVLQKYNIETDFSKDKKEKEK